MANATRIARLGSGAVGAGVAAAVILAALVVLLAWFAAERRQILEQGFRSSSNLTHVLKEQVSGVVSAVDLTFKGIIDTLTLLPDLQDHDPGFEELLRQKLPRLPFVRAIFVIGPNGLITQDTDFPFTPDRNLSDRGYFQAHVGNIASSLHIGPPVQSRSTGTWFVSLSRRLNRADGSFAGIIVAALEVNRFAAFFRLLDLGPHDAIALFLRDGTLLVRIPESKAPVGQAFGESPLFRDYLPTSPHGFFRSASGSDARTRLVSYRALETASLVVAVGLEETALLASWRRNLFVSTAAFVVFALMVAGLVTLFVRIRNRHRRASEQQIHAQRLETLGRMTGGIAHDVNNCLAIMSSGLRLLGRHGTPDADVLSRMEAAVNHGSALMNQLLAFAKRQPLDLCAIDVAARLERLGPLIRQAVGPDVKISTDFPKDLWPSRADRTQFDAAILNLAVNAADAMPSGGWLRVTARNLRLQSHARDFHVPAGEYVQLCVADTGHGMAPETARHAIDPFFSTKGEAGTGLGLSQVYGFMQQIGGDVSIESKMGQGTVVRLLFPRAPAPEVARSRATGDAVKPAGSRDEARPVRPERRISS